MIALITIMIIQCIIVHGIKLRGNVTIQIRQPFHTILVIQILKDNIDGVVMIIKLELVCNVHLLYFQVEKINVNANN